MARYTTDAEVDLLRRYSTISKYGIVEIGVLDGETTKILAENSNCPIYGIDPIIPDSMDEKLIGSKNNILKNMSIYPNFMFYHNYSYNVVTDFNYKFDFIFIDGDHRYDSVIRDFTEWFPKMEIGGYIAFHDSAPVTSFPAEFKGWPGCVRLVDEIKNGLFFDNQIRWVETLDTINVFVKI
jgi:hypothetical protein